MIMCIKCSLFKGKFVHIRKEIDLHCPKWRRSLWVAVTWRPRWCASLISMYFRPRPPKVSPLNRVYAFPCQWSHQTETIGARNCKRTLAILFQVAFSFYCFSLSNKAKSMFHWISINPLIFSSLINIIKILVKIMRERILIIKFFS